jgi:hypothetical protein
MITINTHPLDMVISEVIKDYLVATQSGRADATVTKLLMDTLAEPIRPAIVVTAKEDAVKSTARRVVIVNPVLVTWTASEEAGAASDDTMTTKNEAAIIMAEIDRRLRDHVAFSAWLADSAEQRLDGWVIQKMIHEGMSSPMRPQDRSAFYSLTVRLHLFVPPRLAD